VTERGTNKQQREGYKNESYKRGMLEDQHKFPNEESTTTRTPLVGNAKEESSTTRNTESPTSNKR
jgi:hypothetical protein